MSETYVECLVKHKSSIIGVIVKWILILATAFFGFMGILGATIPFIIAVVTGILAYIVNLRSDLEYEYLYLDREITIDKIMSKSKRKRVGTYEVSRMEIFAPYISHRLDAYKGRKVEEKDCSIGVVQKPDRRYVMYYEGGQRVVLSPSAEMVNTLKNVAPRKVFTD